MECSICSNCRLALHGRRLVPTSPSDRPVWGAEQLITRRGAERAPVERSPTTAPGRGTRRLLSTRRGTTHQARSDPSSPLGQSPSLGKTDAAQRRRVGAAPALHAAYWHDRFGEPKSGGCVNLSVRDAKWLFSWTEPQVPDGWHSVRSGDDRGLGFPPPGMPLRALSRIVTKRVGCGEGGRTHATGPDPAAGGAFAQSEAFTRRNAGR